VKGITNMSDLHKVNLGDLLIEVEEFQDFYDNTHYRDYYVTISSKGFDMYHVETFHSKLNSDVTIDIALRHTLTAEEEFWDQADYEYERGRDK